MISVVHTNKSTIVLRCLLLLATSTELFSYDSTGSSYALTQYGGDAVVVTPLYVYNDPNVTTIRLLAPSRLLDLQIAVGDSLDFGSL